MSKINLLPWREELREVNNRILYAQVACAVLICAGIVYLTNMYFTYRTEVQVANTAYLNKELQSINAQIVEIKGLQESKKNLLERANIIRSLQIDRPSIVRILDLLPRVVPENIYLTEISRDIVGIKPGPSPEKIEEIKAGGELNLMTGIPPKLIGPVAPIVTNQYQVSLKGVAQTNGSISIFLKKLEEIKWLSEVRLSEVSINKEGQGLSFTLDFKQNISDER